MTASPAFPADPPVLHFLDFDYSDTGDGAGVFEAMVSTGPERAPAVRAEIAAVLGWADATFPEARGPVEEGGDWDYDLQAVRETTVAEVPDDRAASGRTATRPGLPGPAWHTITLSIGGSPAFCAALREHFGLD